MKRFILILVVIVSLLGCAGWNAAVVEQDDIASAGLFISNSILDAALIKPELDHVESSKKILDSVLKVLDRSAVDVKESFDFVESTESYKKLVLEKKEYGIAFKILRRRIETRVKLLKVNLDPVTEVGKNNLIRFLTVIREGLEE